MDRGTTRNKEVVGPCPRRQHSLSAACRCASYLPSVPSVLPPEPRTQSVMTGSPTFKAATKRHIGHKMKARFLLYLFCALCAFLWLALIPNRRPFPEKLFVACEVLKGEVARRGIDAKGHRVPAANFPLSAACRCASYLPSVPSVLPPETWTRVSNDRVFLL